MAQASGTLEKTGTAVGAVKPPTAIGKLRAALYAPSTKEQFDNVLKDNAGAFMASVLELASNDKNLQECDPNRLIVECMKAASLKLTLNKNIGDAWVIAYKGVPQFQMGYKGWIQLATRTGQIKRLNLKVVYEGMRVKEDYLTGDIDISGAPTSDKAIGYFAYASTVSGFEKTVYMSKADVEAHAKKYSKSWGRQDSAWTTAFDMMAMKTCFLKLKTFLPRSIEMIRASEYEDESIIDQEIEANANKGQIIEVPKADRETGEIKQQAPVADECPI